MNPPHRRLALGPLCLTLVILAGCASRGGYYSTDGPGAHIPANIAAIPDAVPRIEHPAPANFRPYEVFGVRYVPLAENQPYRKEGIASWYGRKFHGEKTANGETYDMYAMTAAHPTLPVPSYARVTRVSTGKSIIVRINDRGPFHPGRIIDLSYAAAAKLGFVGPGSGEVIVQAITNADILAGNYKNPQQPLLATDTAPPPQVASSSIERTPPVAAPAISSGSRGVYLQFGAFASADNAQAFSQRINAQIGSHTAVTYQASLYKVRLGPYASREEAVRAASTLAQTANINPVIASDQAL